MNGPIPKYRRIAAPFGLSAEGKIKRNILLEISSDGVVRSVDYDVRDMDNIAFAEYYNGILMPSMVNAHCHLELSHMKGKIQGNQPDGLIDFFRDISKMRNEVSERGKILAAKAQDLCMWKEGVSAVADISNDILTLALKSQSNIKYKTFAEYYGYGQKGDAGEYIERKVGRILSYGKSLGLDVSIAPHSTYLVSDEPFKYASNFETVSLHFMESRTEEGFFDAKGEMYNYVDTSFQGNFKPFNYSSPTDRVIKSVSGDVRILLVHCTHIEEKDIDTLVKHFGKVSFVLCPCSNVYIENSLPPVELFVKSGCNVAIGTDGLSSNTSLNMSKEISSLVLLGVSLDKALSWSTYGGSLALGYENELGTFEKGKRSGAVLVSGVDLNKMIPKSDFSIMRIV